MNTKVNNYFVRTLGCLWIIAIMALFLPEPSSAMGKVKTKVSEIKKRGKDKKKSKNKEKLIIEENQSTLNETINKQIIYQPFPGADPYIEPIELTEEETEEKRRFHKLIKQRQFAKSYKVIKQLPEGGLTKKERKIKKDLEIFEEVEALAKENESMFKKDEAMDPSVEKTVKRLYRGAQESILNDKDKLAKDLLIQSLFLDRRNIRSKKLLELGLDSPLGTYKVENVESKYWKQSLISFRSGFPGSAIEDLKVVEYFDPENPEVFERLGSFHYTMGETKEAVDSWKRALYLNPKNKDLEKFIKNAEKEIERQDKLAKERARRKRESTQEEITDENFQLLRVVANANIAYSYAQEVRTQMPGRKVVVEETDDGKYAVKIEKPKENKKEKPTDKGVN